MHFGKLLGACLAVGLLVGAPVLAGQPGKGPTSPGSTTQPAAATAAPATATAAASAPATAAASAAPTPGATAPGTSVVAGGASPTPGAPAPQPGVKAPGAPAGAVDAGMDGQTYTIRLRDLQQRIEQLKEQIRRSHTRLSLLSETVLSGGAAGSRATVRFENKLSSQFQLTRALIVLDGQVQYNKTDQSGVLNDQKVIPLFSGSIPPGDHTVQVLVNLQGNGYGVFSYLRGYKFEVRSSHSFTAVEGKTTRLRIVAYEKGDVTTPLEEQPAVRYVEKVEVGMAGGTEATAPEGGAEP
jgi:hypothetical protein